MLRDQGDIARKSQNIVTGCFFSQKWHHTLSMKPDHHIRRVEANDLMQVVAIADSELREEYDTKLFSHFYEGFRGGFLVAEDGGRLLGFILAVPMDNATLRILMLAVRGEHSRRGIGGSLLDACKQYARLRGMGAIVLEVRDGNTRAVSFYAKAAFQNVGLLAAFYSDGGRALVMKHFLSA